MKRRLIALCIAVCTILSIALAGCDSNSGELAAQSPTSEVTYKDTVIWAQSADVTSMDPHVGKETAAVTVTCNVFSTLMEVIGEDDPQPLIAESYKQLSDKDWEFTIRKGVKFHDGSLLTVEDVKYSLDRAIASNYVNYIVSFIDTVEITGEDTIVVHCKEPYAPILNNLSMPFSAIVPKAYVEEKGEEYFSQHPIGSGPYKLVEWNPSESVKLVAFDEYFQGPPATKNLIMKVIPEAAQRVIALETGEVDIAYSIEANDVDKIDSNPDLVKHGRPSMTCFNFFFNLIDLDRPTSDINVRKAICYAIDRQLIIDTIMRKNATLATSMIAPVVACYAPSPAYEYDLEKAKELMAQSSYPNGCNLVMVVNQSQQRIEICQVVAEMLKELNITAEIRSYEQATYIQALNNHEHDLGFSAWITSTGDADYTYYPCYHSTQQGKPGNRSFFANEEADALIQKGRSTTDAAERIKIYEDLNKIIYDTCTQLFICHPLQVEACSKYVEGFISNKDGYNRLRNVKCRVS